MGANCMSSAGFHTGARIQEYDAECQFGVISRENFWSPIGEWANLAYNCLGMLKPSKTKWRHMDEISFPTYF